jgi:hypothetical protein
MKPDRSNYEIWLIDWLDGNLNEARTEQLMAFLDENPDLKEGADSLSLTRLSPDNIRTLEKKNLKKNASELPPSQIEFLSVAYLENDLTDAQIKDLKENISGNPENRKLFDSIQRTRLRPPEIRFRNKNLLRKRTLTERILRFSVIGLSAAATIALIVLSYIFVPRSRETVNELIAKNLFNDTVLLKPGAVITYRENLAAKEQYQAETSEANSVIEIFVPDESQIIDMPVAFLQEDSSSFSERSSEFLISAIPVSAVLEISKGIAAPSLVASNIVIEEIPYYDSERSRLRRFIASTFREKILKNKEYNDSPLKSYELAEAGIEGLNELLGWEMALVKTSDEEGELKSLYFSSRVLKINTPVKKSNPSL